MSARCRIVALISAVLLSAGAGRAEDAKLEQKVYSVADLVVPVGDADQGEKSAAATGWAAARMKPSKTASAEVRLKKAPPGVTHEDRLIKIITDTIAPSSWSERGGSATIEYFPLGMSLVIYQTPDVQDQIADLLAALRRLQDIEVAVEVKFVDVATDVFQALQRKGILGDPDKNTHHSGGVACLNDAQILRFMDAIQEDVRTNVMQAPG